MPTLLENGWIYTPARVFRRGSLLVRGDRIERVFLENSEPARPAPADIATVDLRGGYLLPGFVDSHTHLTSLALKEARCDLSAARSAADVCRLLEQWAAARDTPGIMGVDWDESGWTDSAHPTRSTLDAIENKRPVLARRICGHMGVANTPLLERLPPQTGLINGDTGVIREHALWEAGRICGPALETLHEGMETAIRSMHRLGITAIHDIVEPAKFDFYFEGVMKSRVPLRVDVLMHTHPDDLSPYIEKARRMDSTLFRIAGVKCFLDGSLGGKTAALNEPYVNSDTERGKLLLRNEELATIVEASVKRGYVCAMHAIGDRAIDQALEAATGVPRDAEHLRIEHCEVVGDKQVERLARSPVLLAVQPNFVRNWGIPGGPYEQQLGSARFRHCNRWRTLRESGVAFVFGSDCMPPGPLHGLPGATEHPIESERLDAADAIDRYTRLSNQVGLHKREAGIIEPGKLADLVLLDGDPLKGDFSNIRVMGTFVGGCLVYDAASE
jgi:predicted amidohydrolase YtcJ